MTKQELRKIKSEERNRISEELRHEWSVQICENLHQTFEYHQCSLIHVFLSHKSEPDTSHIISKALADSKKVVVPVANDSGSLQHFQYNQDTIIVEGRFGVPVPQNGIEVLIQELSNSNALVIIPMLAFNERLFRLGYGGGYYDKFLQDLNCFAFGVAFTMQFAPELQEEQHDVPMNAIVTEQGLIRSRTSRF